MRKISLVVLSIIPGLAFSQKPPDGITDCIYVGQQKNSYLEINGDAIRAVDIGAPNGKILYEQLPGTNIIKLKAAEAEFKETNMLVVTQDTVIQFLLRYAQNPTRTLYKYSFAGPLKKNYTTAQNTPDSITLKTRTLNFDKVKNLRPNLFNVDMSSGIKGTLLNIAQDGSKIYFAIKIDNLSKIDYIIDIANFEIRTRSRGLRRMAGQSNMPDFQEDLMNPKLIRIGRSARLYYALDLFPLRADETLFITFFEKNGVSKGRQIRIKVYNNDFRKIEILK